MGTTLKLIVGLALVIAASGYLSWYAWQEHLNRPHFTTMLSDQRCQHPLYEVRMEPTVLTEDTSATLQVYLRQEGNPAMWPPGYQRQAEANAQTGPCDAHVRLFAPSFHYEPIDRERIVTLPASLDQKLLVWVVAPKKRGNHRLVVSSGFDTWVVRATVMTSLGVTALQAAWGAFIVILLGSAYTFTQIIGVLRRRHPPASG